MNNSNGLQLPDLGSLSREELLSLAQAQLRLQQQQQQSQAQPSLLSSASANSLLSQQQQQQSHFSQANDILLGQQHQQQNQLSQAKDVLQARLLQQSLSGNNSNPLAALLAGVGSDHGTATPAQQPGLADLLRSHLAGGISAPAPPSSLDNTGGLSSIADLLQAGNRLAGGGLDPLALQTLLLRQNLFGSQMSGAAAGLGALSSLGVLPQADSSSNNALLRQLMRANEGATPETGGQGGLQQSLAQQQAEMEARPMQNGRPLTAGQLLGVPGFGSAPAPTAPEEAHVQRMGVAAAAAAAATASLTEVTASGDGKVKAAAAKKKTKRPLSAYNIFFKEEHAKIISQNEKDKAERVARGETIEEEEEYEEEETEGGKKGKKRKISLSTNQPGKRGKRQVDFENLTKVIGKRWKELPPEKVEEYKRRAEEAMQTYRKQLFQKIRNSVKEDQT
jgi:hypothetical protein